MIYLNSYNPDNYETVKFSSSAISKNNGYIKYRINSVSFSLDVLFTTSEDNLKINNETINWINHSMYKSNELIKRINEILNDNNLTSSRDETNRIKISSDNNFIIHSMTHNLELLFGAYNMTYPINSELVGDKYEIVFKSCPLLTYGNNLYLVAKNDFLAFISNGQESAQSIAYKIESEILYNGFNFKANSPGDWVYVKSDSLNNMEFVLCDFSLTPIKLLSPLFLSIETNYLSGSDILSADVVLIKERDKI